MRAARAIGWLAAGYALVAGCGDVTGDLIVRDDPAPAPTGCAGDGDCPNARCELASGSCVECLDSADCDESERCALPANVCAARCVGPESCGGATPICELATGACRACGGDAECPSGAPRCAASGACVECLESADCRDDDDEEEEDDDDDDALFCDPAGRCVECLDDGHCDDVGDRCSPFLGECARPCSPTAACTGDDPICDEAIGFCVECRTDGDCEDGEVCRGLECVD